MVTVEILPCSKKTNRNEYVKPAHFKTVALPPLDVEMAASVLAGVVLVAVIAGEILSIENKKASFTFPEFPYKESIKNEMAFREYESACEQTPSCIYTTGIARVRCLRECVSPSCYQDIYQADQLEEGEIDVRLNSFKGCFIQRASRPRP